MGKQDLEQEMKPGLAPKSGNPGQELFQPRQSQGEECRDLGLPTVPGWQSLGLTTPVTPAPGIGGLASQAFDLCTAPHAQKGPRLV